AHSPAAQQALELARRIVVLQPLGVEALPATARAKARVIVQSARAPAPAPPSDDAFEVCVLGHLRAVKDPLLAADATHLLPSDSRLRVLHLGGALDADLERRARAEAA